MATEAMRRFDTASDSTTQLSTPDPSQHQLKNMLQTLPDKVSYPVMVPFGSVAFFPGRLIHTNECMVDLGGDTMVEMSAKETMQLLQARQDTADSTTPVEALKQPDTKPDQASPQRASTLQQAQQTAASVEDQILEIMEEYDEAIHGPLQKALPEYSDHAISSNAVMPVHTPSSAPSSLTQQTGHTGAATATQQQSDQQTQSSSVSHSASHGHQARPPNKAIQATSPSPHLANITGKLQHVSVQQQPIQEQQQQMHQQQHKSQMHKQQQQQVQQEQCAQRQQACAQDDADFERMMARFDELERQEAAAPSGEITAVNETASARLTNASASSSVNPAAPVAAPLPDSKLSKNSGMTANSATEQPPPVSKAVKPSTGLKRGFFAKPARPETTALAKKSSSSSHSLEASQPSKNVQPQAKAFTGNIVEHTVVTNESSSVMAPSSTSKSPGQTATQSQKRVSRFKQSRHVQHD